MLIDAVGFARFSVAGSEVGDESLKGHGFVATLSDEATSGLDDAGSRAQTRTGRSVVAEEVVDPVSGLAFVYVKGGIPEGEAPAP